jgi:hypothetical protein
MNNEIERYDLVGADCGMCPTLIGDFVRYEDHVAALADRDSRLAASQARRQMLLSACKSALTDIKESNSVAEEMVKQRDDLREQLAAAQRSAEDARRDSERIDWLAENSLYEGGGNGGWYRWHTPADLEHGLFRAEVDAAMSAQGPASAMGGDALNYHKWEPVSFSHDKCKYCGVDAYTSSPLSLTSGPCSGRPAAPSASAMPSRRGLEDNS